MTTTTTTTPSSFRNKVVVITGGASGIGKSLAKAFDREGAIVVVMDLKGSDAAKVEISSSSSSPNGKQHLAFDCDVTNQEQLSKALESVKRRYQRIDIYCSNAGIVFPPTNHNITNNFDVVDDKVTKHSAAQWDKILQVNLMSHVTALRLLLPDWESGKGDGIFCMTASAAGLLTMVGDTSYGVTKAAAVSLAEHLAIAHGDVVQVHCLCPQAVDTPFITGGADAINAAMTDGVVSPDFVAECTLVAIQKKEFFIFPHPEVPTYFERKAKDHARWLKGMQRLRNRMMQSKL